MAKKKTEIKINFTPVEGDLLQSINDAFAPDVERVLNKHGAYLKIPFIDILRSSVKSDRN
ncbi:hypothetical protein D3C74_159690 [compost metagenome]